MVTNNELSGQAEECTVSKMSASEMSTLQLLARIEDLEFDNQRLEATVKAVKEAVN